MRQYTNSQEHQGSVRERQRKATHAGSKGVSEPPRNMMKYASKDLYEYANQMPTFKKYIKKTVLEFLNLDGLSAEKEARWYQDKITQSDIAIFKKSDAYLMNQKKFDAYVERFASAVNNIEIGTRRNEEEKHRRAKSNNIIEAAKAIYYEINNNDYRTRSVDQSRLLYEPAL